MKKKYKQLPRKQHTFKWVDHHLYNTWQLMKARCYNKTTTNYKNWGGRGIKVCKKWRYNFEQFVKDMGDKPKGDYSIDRIDNDGDYKPSNCRWATRVEQNKNKRTYVTSTTGYSGITKTQSGGYQVRVKNEKTILGVFKTLDEAIDAQNKNKKQTKPRLNNTTGLKGVTFDKQTGLYKVRKKINGNRVVLGFCSTLFEAEKIYNEGNVVYRKIGEVKIRGITKNTNGTFRVRKTINGKRVDLGSYKNLDDAKKVLNENS